ncbi:MAG: HIT family protein [Chloroflexota bacterium]|nr:HIT family protein [Chloroflexota bacterium]
MVAEDPRKQQESGRDEGAGCVFCAIVAGTAPASVVHDAADVLAFLDIRPITPGHLLVIPKRHARHLADLDEAVGERMYRVAARLARALRASGLRCEGVNLFLADGEAAGQEVFHVHLHVFPRFAGDGFRLEEDGSARPPRAELDASAVQLRDAYAALWEAAS